MASDNDKPDGKVVRFRLWILLIYAIGGAAVLSGVIGFSRFPPNRQTLGDAAYFRTWTMLVIGGAVVGCVNYLFSLYLARRKARRG